MSKTEYVDLSNHNYVKPGCNCIYTIQAEHDSCKQLSSEVISFELMSEEREVGSAFAFKRLWWMTPVPLARAVISLTPDRSEVLKENGKLIYLNFHPEQIVHPRNPTRRCTERLENCRRVLPVALMWKDTILISSYAIVSLCCTTINVIWKTDTMESNFGIVSMGLIWKASSIIIILDLSICSGPKWEKGFVINKNAACMIAWLYLSSFIEHPVDLFLN